jgi:hypothetical protein
VANFTQYEKFWEKPLDTPIMWFGLLFGMMCTGTLHEQWSPNEAAASFHRESTPDPRHLISRYREKTVQCLVLGGYTEPSQYTIETLLLYLHAEYVRREDAQMGNWVLLGIIIRLAFRMSYHTDGSQLPQISPFQAEMRRRIWTVLFMLDVVTSAQVGLPRMIKDSQCNSAEPRNLMDKDLDESITELPDARPDTVQTSVQFSVTKSRVAHVFGMVSDLTSTPTCSYEQVMVLDKVLRDTYNAIPKWLMMRPTAQSAMDSLELITRRIYVAILFHKARCVLHRKYMLQRTEGNWMYSRTTCIEAALRILEIQQDVNREMEVGGRLYRDRWKISSILKHDFLLATKLLCLMLDQSLSAESYSKASESPPDIETKENVSKVLNESYIIWLHWSNSSKEARKAVEAMRTVLDKAQRLSTRSSIDVKGMPDNAAINCDESFLRRPKPINFFPPSRRLRGPMVLPPPTDDASWEDGVKAALEPNKEPGNLVRQIVSGKSFHWTDFVRVLVRWGIRFQIGEISWGCRMTLNKDSHSSFLVPRRNDPCLVSTLHLRKILLASVQSNQLMPLHGEGNLRFKSVVHNHCKEIRNLAGAAR